MDNNITTDAENKKKPKTFKSLIVTAIITFVGMLVVWSAIIWLVQPMIFFYPWHDNASHERLLNDETFEEIIIDNGGQTLTGWFRANIDSENGPLLILFGGNAQSASNTCAEFLDNGTYSYFEGYNFLMVDYPGYGLSEGDPSDTTMFEAALSIYDYACEMENVDDKNIVILGYSIGTGVATYVASQRDVNGLILMAPYDRALNLYNDTLNIFHGPIEFLARYKFDSMSYAPDVQVMPLIITSKGDEVISYELSLNLAKHFHVNPDVLLLDYVEHNYYLRQNTTLSSIQRYLQERNLS